MSLFPDAAPPAPVPERILPDLRVTRRWVLFFAVLAWINVAFSAFLGGSVAFGALVGMVLPQFRVIAYVYLAAAFLGVPPALFLTRYVRALRRVLRTRSEEHLVDALRNERRYWKFVGLFVMTLIGLTLLAIAAIWGVRHV